MIYLYGILLGISPSSLAFKLLISFKTFFLVFCCLFSVLLPFAFIAYLHFALLLAVALPRTAVHWVGGVGVGVGVAVQLTAKERCT